MAKKQFLVTLERTWVEEVKFVVEAEDADDAEDDINNVLNDEGDETRLAELLTGLEGHWSELEEEITNIVSVEPVTERGDQADDEGKDESE